MAGVLWVCGCKCGVGRVCAGVQPWVVVRGLCWVGGGSATVSCGGRVVGWMCWNRSRVCWVWGKRTTVCSGAWGRVYNRGLRWACGRVDVLGYGLGARG